jgi:hypothetical protein
MQKRGQVTIFIIIGLIIIVTVGFLMSSRSLDVEKNTDIQEDLTSDINSVNDFVDSCIKNVLEKALENIKICNVTELEEYMDNNLRPCTLNNFNVFEGINITEQKLPKSKINLTNTKNSLLVSIDYPLTLKKHKSTSNIEEFFLDYNFPVKRNIEIIGDEESISNNIPGRAISIDTDSNNQPHILTESNSNTGGFINAYHKIQNSWLLQEPMPLNPSTNPGVDTGYHVPTIRIDKFDRAWISMSQVSWSDSFDFDFSDSHCCNAMALFEDVASNPTLTWGAVRINYGFVSSLAIDPYHPNKAYQYNGNGGLVEWNINGVPSLSSVPSAGCGGCEPGSIAITPRENQQGKIHTLSISAYRNQDITNDVYPWADYLYPQVTDHTYFSVVGDLKNTDVAYLVAPFNGLILNIWDGTSLKYPPDNLYQIDPYVLGESANGGSGGRIQPGLSPTLGGGAFLCWTNNNNHIMLKYVSDEGECFFGDTVDIGLGSQCAIATDSNGDIHVAYNNGGLKYRKIITSY